MSGRDQIEQEVAGAAVEETGPDLLRPLMKAQPGKASPGTLPGGVLIGELIGMMDGRTPLVLYPGQPNSAALPARTVVDLHGPHIGSKVVLMFERGDPEKPLVMGVLREAQGWP